ncbi:MAG TPA: hypothetical protein VK961_20700 [Chthoniobacter sp.]|nr:hypothetical protein [Chthoniobacter sp.]
MLVSWGRIAWLLIFGALFLPACAIAPVAYRTPFNEAEFAPYRGAGSASVSGTLTVRGGDDQWHIGDQNNVSLVPVTSYTREFVDRFLGDGQNLSASPRLQSYLRFTKTDGQGHFRFERIRPGEYFIIGLASWGAPGESDAQWACERVRVAGGQAAQVQLSRNVLHTGKTMLIEWPPF